MHERDIRNINQTKEDKMANKLTAINQLRPKIASQGIADLEEMAQRVAKNTTYNTEEIYSILRLYVQETNAALQTGETVKIDGLLKVSPNMKVGGKVNMSLRGDRGSIAGLNNPLLWTGGKVTNHANMSKTSDELVAQWNAEHPGDLVEE